MDSILGLPDFAAFKKQGAVRTSHRRRILHSFPNGGSPLTGILSMLKTEPVDSVEHTWYEKRYVPARTTLRGTNPITSTAPVETSGGAGDEGDADTGTNSTGTVTTATALYIKLGSTERIAPGHLLMLETGIFIEWLVSFVALLILR
ncbi:MAG: hypothetical protein HC840_01180 [Leptolyngbyaceae cyanobacterium RM2_2_4]|nr:hypothetical protein [Leptolyngbyaceae cyanobacterium RM2_2_4]